METIKVKQTRVSRHKNFHFKVEVNIKGMPTLTKYYFTKAAITKEHGISGMSIYRVLSNPDHRLKKKYEHLTITKVCEPAVVIQQLHQPKVLGASSVSVSQTKTS